MLHAHHWDFDMFVDYEIKIVNSVNDSKLRAFLDKHHYIKSLPRGCDKVFCLYICNVLSGLATYGYPVGRNAIKSYGNNIKELKRFCLVDGLPKNTASWFMAKCNRQLKQDGLGAVLSYSDPKQGHTGIIYKASNFLYLGKQKQGTPYYKVGPRKVYSRNMKGAILKRHPPKDIFLLPLNN